jgi:hypothetical protein
MVRNHHDETHRASRGAAAAPHARFPRANRVHCGAWVDRPAAVLPRRAADRISAAASDSGMRIRAARMATQQ